MKKSGAGLTGPRPMACYKVAINCAAMLLAVESKDVER